LIAKKLRQKQIKGIQRILIRSTNWIGDAIMTTPAVRAVRKNFPHAHISLLAKPWVIPIFEHSSNIDQIIEYDINGRHKGVRGIFRLARDIRTYSFDAVILFQNAIEAAIISRLANIPIRIGYNTDGRGLLLSHSVKRDVKIKTCHQTLYYLDILEKIGLYPDGNHLELSVDPLIKEAVHKIIQQYNIASDELIVGINPSATYGTAKQWFPERFAELADQICKSYPARIIIFGGPGDIDLGRRIESMVNYPVINLSAKTSLGEAIGLIQACQLFITNDSGLMHIAAALNTPLIALFGSTNPITTGPLGKHSIVVREPVSCSPCLKVSCPLERHICMERISVENVFYQVKRML